MGIDFYISLIGSVGQKILLDVLHDLSVLLTNKSGFWIGSDAGIITLSAFIVF